MQLNLLSFNCSFFYCRIVTKKLFLLQCIRNGNKWNDNRSRATFVCPKKWSIITTSWSTLTVFRFFFHELLFNLTKLFSWILIRCVFIRYSTRIGWNRIGIAWSISIMSTVLTRAGWFSESRKPCRVILSSMANRITWNSWWQPCRQRDNLYCCTYRDAAIDTPIANRF